MTADLARMVMASAHRLLRDGRPEWSAAMQGEFEEVADGRSLPFALGCLATAWRQLPFHADGRLRLTTLVVALGVIVPVAVINLICATPGIHFMLAGHDHYYDALAAGNERQRSLAAAYRAAVPWMTALIFALGLLHVSIVRALIARRWRRVVAQWALTLVVATILLLLGYMLLPGVGRIAFTVYLGLAIELVAVPAFILWHARVRTGSVSRTAVVDLLRK